LVIHSFGYANTASPANIRFRMAVGNTLAYYDMATIMALKSFINKPLAVYGMIIRI
jgi:hypothetical protein